MQGSTESSVITGIAVNYNKFLSSSGTTTISFSYYEKPVAAILTGNATAFKWIPCVAATTCADWAMINDLANGVNATSAKARI